MIFTWGENESLRAWRLDPNTGVLSFVGKGAEVASAALAASPKGIGGMPGGMLALSSNGASPNLTSTAVEVISSKRAGVS